MRARICAENAEASKDAMVAGEFAKLAAQWRAMAVSEQSLGGLAEAGDVAGCGSAVRAT